MSNMTRTEFEEEVDELFPDRSEDEVDNLLWNVTPFPVSSLEETVESLREFKEAEEEGKSICMQCGRWFEHPSGDVWLDATCEDADLECKEEYQDAERQTS